MNSAGHILAKLHYIIERIFPERQIFLRIDGDVRFQRFSRARQMWLVSSAVVLLAWTAFATFAYFSSDSRLSEMSKGYTQLKQDLDTALHRAREVDHGALVAAVTPHGSVSAIEAPGTGGADEVGRLSAAARELNDHVATIASNLQKSQGVQERLASALETLTRERDELDTKLADSSKQKDALERRIAGIAAKMNGSRAEQEWLSTTRQTLTHERDDLHDKLAAAARQKEAFERRLADLGAELDKSHGQQQKLAAARDGLSRERDDLAAQRDQLRADLVALSWQNDGLQERSTTLERQLADVSNTRDKLGQERIGFQGRIADLQGQLESVQEGQKVLVKRLSARVSDMTLTAERAIAMTGLDVGRLMRELDAEHLASDAPDDTHAAPAAAAAAAAPEGMGGPFIALDSEVTPRVTPVSFHAELDHMVSTLDQQAQRRQALDRIVSRLPLGSPIDDFQLKSPFGPRLDPINGKFAFHPGLDLTGAIDAAVLATAPGRVVFAGPDGGYGNMVEIDHGLGIHTRYAHLRKILVKVGQKVLLRSQLGIVGTTGRSTGTHVHYEVLVDDQAYDPAKFLEAGTYVLSKD